MPIGDLLAQISGDNKASGSSAPAVRRSDSFPTSKRKADEDLRNNASKTPRFTPSARPARPPTNDVPTRPAAIPSRPLINGNRVERNPAGPSATRAPPPPPPNEPVVKPKGPPKKGSFAEILARGQRAQAVMGQVGKIQHKKVEKGATRKDSVREEGARRPAAATAAATAPGKRPLSGYSGTSKPAAHRNGAADGGAAATATSTSHASRNRVAAPSGRPVATAATAATAKRAAAAAAAAAEAEKKVKKAAAATTGYTGTARPRPGAPTKKGTAPRGGALLNAPPPRARASQRSRYEDNYDAELDDFIDYDEEEDEGGPQYGYASDGSSDMEAGMDDIDDEERQAERIARREDLEQERLERTLKNAKEEKKRRALEALRASRR